MPKWAKTARLKIMTSGDVSIAVVTLQFEASNLGGLVAVLSKYVVMTRMSPGCRNVDLVISAVRDNRVLVIQKWDSIEAQRTHFDSALMVEMAKSCKNLLTKAPEVELWDSISSHDLA